MHTPGAGFGKASIALDWYPNANHAGLFWAQSKALPDAGVDISIQTPADPTTVLQTVAAGRDTFGISYQPDILLARAQDVPVVAVCAIVPRPLQGVMSLKSAGIARPSDLRGKTVGYPGIPSQEAFLQTMLAADGVSMDEITLNNVEFNLLPSLISGQAAAVMGAFWTHETIVAELEGYPVDMMKVEDWGVPLYDELVLVSSEKTLANKRDLVDAVLDAVREGTWPRRRTRRRPSTSSSPPIRRPSGRSRSRGSRSWPISGRSPNQASASWTRMPGRSSPTG